MKLFFVVTRAIILILSTRYFVSGQDPATKLSNGAELSITISNPTNGLEIPLNPTCSADSVIDGNAAIGQGVPDVSYIFIIDDSGSTVNILSNIKTFFKGLAHEVFEKGSAKNVGVVRFSTSASITQALTNSIPSIEAGINAAQTSGSTNCIDGLQKARDLATSANVGGTTIVLFAGDGGCNTPSNSDPTSAAQSLAALTNTKVVIDTIAIGTPCAGGLQSIPQNGGSCRPVSVVSDYNIQSVIGTTLKDVRLKVDAGDWTVIPTTPTGDKRGPAIKQFHAPVSINIGPNTICVSATGDDDLEAQSDVTVVDCIGVVGKDTMSPTLLCPDDVTRSTDVGKCTATVNPLPGPTAASDNCDSDLTPSTTATGPFPLASTTVAWTVSDDSGNTGTCSYNIVVEDNEPPTLLCPSDITRSTDVGKCTATVDPLPGPTAASDNCDNNLTPSTTATGPFPLASTKVTWSASDDSGNIGTCSFNIVVEDKESPVATCRPGVNPAGKTPQANNQDGFFVLTGTDNCAVASIYVVDTGSGNKFGPYPTGTNFKYVQAPGSPVKEKPGTGAVKWMLTGKGDAQVLVTDKAGNVQTAKCLVPPPPARNLRAAHE